mmetsp:Transcript_57603/g.84463  ORF Transcript_57603/g.84463 Transcript_57603/m.84463 type:complete len:112 (+) Transcript_57603:93-428(+)
MYFIQHMFAYACMHAYLYEVVYPAYVCVCMHMCIMNSIEYVYACICVCDTSYCSPALVFAATDSTFSCNGLKYGCNRIYIWLQQWLQQTLHKACICVCDTLYCSPDLMFSA